MNNRVVMDNSSKVIRISSLNHNRIVSKGHYGDTFDSILSRILDFEEERSEERKKLTENFDGLPYHPKFPATTKQDKDINFTNYKDKNFTKKTNIHYNLYESFNVVSETGDSIYSPEYEEFTTLDNNGCRGQIFISEAAIEEIVDRIIDQRLGLSINNNKENG
jgi:hypothetical protein